VEDIQAGHSEFLVRTGQGEIEARYVINAAGEWVDKIAAMVNADDFVLFPIKGYVGVLDRNCSHMAGSLLAVLPRSRGT
jgi:glycerol-3-phosphate dehydrogenase